MDERTRTATTQDPVAAKEKTLLVSELYRSLQGESTFAGWPCAFVRLTGCPLRCAWCDSDFAFQGGERMALGEVLARVEAFGINLVEVTGGEPLAQPNCLELLRRLCDAGYQTLLETSGSVDIGPVDPRVIKIMDVKCPGSGEVEANRWENLERLGPRDELKFVLAGREDYDWALRLITGRGLAGSGRVIHFSPVFGNLEPAELAGWMIADRAPARLQLQLHKILWPGQTRGI